MLCWFLLFCVDFCVSVLYMCISIPALHIHSPVPFFWIPYICINIYLFFSFWLASLCVTGCRLLQAQFNWHISSSLWLSSIPLYVCTTTSLSIHQWTSRLLPCPGVVNSAAVNIGVQVSFWIMFFSRYKIHWKRTWQPTPVFLPGESHGQQSLAGYSPWVTKNQTWLKCLSRHTCKVCWVAIDPCTGDKRNPSYLTMIWLICVLEGETVYPDEAK